MAEITLRDYLAKLDTLLNTGHSSEVIHHCRQILQYFPKNVEAYRYLGRALVDTKSYREAGEVLRRVLGVYPDDFFAHAGLSEVYMSEKQFDKAIWHLERAFDQDPNNQSILTALRELYRKHRHVENVKVQLTAGAVARQYLRNGLYPQAIDSLQQAILHAPDRTDIKLLLAKTLWDAGMKVEAAENALEVVKTLPDCLEANRILTELWLGESRPSDAQRYISHIQSVDPYLALELAQGQSIPNSAFKLEELDYRRAAEREIVSNAPDWLQAIGQSAEAGAASSETASDWMSMTAASTSLDDDDDELPDVFDKSFTSELPRDWLSGAKGVEPTAEEAAAEELPPVPAPRVRTGLTGLLSTLNTPEEAKPPVSEPEPASSAVEDEMPDLDFSAPPSAAASQPAAQSGTLPAGSTLDDLFPDIEEAPVVPKPRQTGALMDSDPLAWMRDTGVELVEDQRTPDDDLFGVGDDATPLPDAQAADPLAWLKDSGGEDLILDTNDDLPIDIVEDGVIPGTVPAEEDADPLAWLKDSGGEFIPEEQEPIAETYTTSPSAVKNSDDPLDWLADESMLDEALSMEALIDSPISTSTSEEPASGGVPVPATADMPDREENMTDDKNNDLDWLNSDEPEPKPEAESFTWASQNESSINEDFPDLFAGLGDENDVPAQPASTDDLPNFDEAAAEVDVPDWLSEAAPQTPAPSAQAPADDNGFEWMTEATASSEEEPAAVDADVPDWLSQMQPAEASTTTDEPDAIAMPSSEDDGGFEWMTETTASSEEPAAVDADVPDWLSAMEPQGESEPEPAMASAETPADDSGFEWMTETTASSEEPAAVDADVPDWLSAMEPQGESEPEPAMASAETPADDSGFEWMTEATASSEEPAVSGDVPDWLTQAPEQVEVQPNAPAAELPTDSEFEWTAQPGDAVDDAVASGQAPDWLADLQAAEEGDLAAEAPNRIEAELAQPDDLSSLLGDAIPEDEGELAAEAPNRLETELSVDDDGLPKWLTETNQFKVPDEVAAEASASIPEPAAEMEQPDWLSQMEPEAAAEPQTAAVDDTPDWLSEMAPAAEAASAVEAPTATDDGFDWMAEAANPAAPTEDVPDWLSAMEPEDENEVEPTSTGELGFSWEAQTPEEQQPIAEHDDLDWLTADDDSEAPAPIEEDTPDWLTQIQTGEHQTMPEETPVASGEPEFSWQTELTDHNEPAATADVPDWLSEAQPEASAAVDETALPGEVPDWLQSMQTEAPPPAAASAPRSLAETRDLDDTAYSWENKTEVNNTPVEADATPDWLSEAAPGPVTQPVAEGEFSWEDSVQASEEPAIDDDTPDWLKEMQPAASETNASAVGDAVPAEDLSWLEDSGEENTEAATAQPEAEFERPEQVEEDSFAAASLLHLDDLEAETAPVPAANAPDWLNAMVPGLDVDFDAPEDEQMEQEFLPGSENRAEPIFQTATTTNRANREFDWLVDIVDEETQQVGATKSRARRRQFVFSREPVWLRKPIEMSDTSAAVGNTAVIEQTDEGNDEVDLPPWLQ